jgi:arginyl-tRNA synthetase
VGNEQNYHFQVLSLLLDRLGFKWGKDLVHFSYGMVELPEGKMKSREGTVVDADDLMDEMVAGALEVARERGKAADNDDEAREVARIVGMGALKYFLLKVDPRKNMTFNPKESIDFNGNTGPFIQYTYARIRSLLRKAADKGFTTDNYLNIAPNDKELELIQTLSAFPATVQEAGRTYSPALIANYAYDLVKEYNQFYHDYGILNEADAEVRALRLTLSDAVSNVVRTAMSLLGIEVPERM